MRWNETGRKIRWNGSVGDNRVYIFNFYNAGAGISSVYRSGATWC